MKIYRVIVNGYMLNYKQSSHTSAFHDHNLSIKINIKQLS